MSAVVGIVATEEQMKSLEADGFCVMAPELHGTDIAHWGVGSEFYLKHNSKICYVRVVARQEEKVPDDVVKDEPYGKTFLVCVPAMPPDGDLRPK